MLERLAGNHHIRRCARDLAPRIRRAQDDVHVRAWGHVETGVHPRRRREEVSVAAVDVQTADVEDSERMLLARGQGPIAEPGHLVE